MDGTAMIDVERRSKLRVNARWDESPQRRRPRTAISGSNVVMISTGRPWPQMKTPLTEQRIQPAAEGKTGVARRRFLDLTFFAITVAMAVLVWCSTR